MPSTIEGFKNSNALTAAVKYVLYAQMFVAVISMVSSYLEYELLTSFQNGSYASQEQAIADGESSDQRQSLIGTMNFIVFIVSGILILRWIHRANYNARQLGAENMKFTPGWSIGYFFIPIKSFWKPYQAMKEIWKATKNPSDWTSQSTDGILPIWWSLWLLSLFLGQAILRISARAEEIHELLYLNILSQVSNAIDIGLAFVFLRIVKNISNFQAHNVKGHPN